MDPDNCSACVMELAYDAPYPAEEHTCGEESSASSASTASAYTFDNYQQDTGTTAIYPGAGTAAALNYLILKLNGEAGEVAEKWGKLYRDRGHLISSTETPIYKLSQIPDFHDNIIKELGDVLWYASQLATELGVSLGDIAAANIRKLQKRSEAGTLHGSGDDR